MATRHSACGPRVLHALPAFSASLFVVAFVACADAEPSGPTAEPVLPLPAVSVSPPGAATADGEIVPLDRHVILLRGRMRQGLAGRLAAFGGTLLRYHPEIGVAIVSGLSDEAAARIGKSRGITGIARDVALTLIPEVEDVGVRLESLPASAAKAGRKAQAAADNPAGASFASLQWDMQAIDADDAWNAGFRGDSKVRVAILDTGIDPNHPDLAGLVDASSSVAFLPSTNGPPEWADDHWHGTHVAGTVATNNIGTGGIAPGTTLIAVKICGTDRRCAFGDILSGIVHAANEQADVINLSLAGGFPKGIPGASGLGFLVGLVTRAVNFANRQGALVVSAAGNDAANLDRDGNFFAFPCQAGTGICVSATGPDDVLASYSNFGASAIDVGAPGGDFVDTFAFPTSTVLSPCSTRSVVIPLCQTGIFYLFTQGTSMATPHVSGAAALIDAQAGGRLNGGQLEAILQRSAESVAKPGSDRGLGKGRINVCAAVKC